jgi:excisionase family DNA binding protein
VAIPTLNGSATTPEHSTEAPADTGGLTVAQAAARLGLSKVAVRHKIRRGSLPAFKDAEGGWRVPPAAVEAAHAAVPPTEYAAAQEAVHAAARSEVHPAAPGAAQGVAYAAAQGEAQDQEMTPGEILTAALAAAQAAEVRRLEETLALAREELEVRRREQEAEREAHRREVEQLHTLLAQAHQLALPPSALSTSATENGRAEVDPEPESAPSPEGATRRWWQRLLWG